MAKAGSKTTQPKKQTGSGSSEQQQSQNFSHEHDPRETHSEPRSGDSPKPHGDHFANVVRDEKSGQ